MPKIAISNHLDNSLDPQARYFVCKSMAAGYAQSIKSDSKRLEQARLFTLTLVNTYWNDLCSRHNTCLPITTYGYTRKHSELPVDVKRLAEDTGKIIAMLPVEDSAFLVGSVYTTMMPDQLRAEMGAYYTPPPLVDRLINLAEKAGFNLKKSSAIDPSCGGGAFLVPLVLKMWKADCDSAPKFTFKRLVSRIRGIELDPFSAWISRVVLEAALLPLCVTSRLRLPEDVIVCSDALKNFEIGMFDLVIGNPPYGRVTLSKAMRDTYQRSLYGHANLYGLFTDLALRIVKPNGIVAYLTPTSFLGGKYFMNLRNLIIQKATPVAFDFVSDRDGVFENVLQETILAAFKVGQHKQKASVSTLVPKGMHSAHIERVGHVSITQGTTPWLIPRTSQDSQILNAIREMPTRLKHLGYDVSTGQLVWNRFKSQLKNKSSSKTLPLIWAESVTNSGFNFSSEKRNHLPYFEIQKSQKFLVTRKSCVLVQRTTSIEQSRRLIAAVLPQKFIEAAGGVVVENHLNMVYSNEASTLIEPDLIAVLMNSKVIDQVFRCISGSVAVSAYELNNLPLPTETQLLSLSSSIKRGARTEFIEKKIASFYGVN